MLSHVQLFVTLWTVTHQGPLSIGFFSKNTKNGMPFPPPGGLPDPGMELMSPALAGGFFTTKPPGKTYFHLKCLKQIMTVNLS